jgi:DNA-binding MarR family transcriptional regulator
MVNITKKESIVLERVKIFNPEFEDGIPIKVIQDDLDVHEHNLHDVLKSLSKKGLISYEDMVIKLINEDAFINTVATKEDVIELELDQKEANALKIIESIVDEKNLVPKYVLEGNLLYGPEKISNFRMYHILLSLEIKGILKKIRKKDGRYYLLVKSKEA